MHKLKTTKIKLKHAAWKLGLQLFFTAQIDILLSAYINLKSDAEKVSKDDWYSYANAIISLVLYFLFSLAIVKVIRECLRVIYDA